MVTGGQDKVIRVFNQKTDESVNINVYEDIYKIAFACDCQKVVAFIHRLGERRVAIFSVFWKK